MGTNKALIMFPVTNPVIKALNKEEKEEQLPLSLLLTRITSKPVAGAREGEQCLLAILITAQLFSLEKLRSPWGLQLMQRALYSQSP